MESKKAVRFEVVDQEDNDNDQTREVELATKNSSIDSSKTGEDYVKTVDESSLKDVVPAAAKTHAKPNLNIKVNSIKNGSKDVDDDVEYGISPESYETPGEPSVALHAITAVTPKGTPDPDAEEEEVAPKKLKDTKHRKFFPSKSVKNVAQYISKKGSASRFKKWTREEMIDIIICNDIELRAESQIPTVSLRDICDQIYDGQPMPEKVPKLTMKQLIILNKYALKIQELYTERLYRRRLNEELEGFEMEEDAEEFEAEEVAVTEHSHKGLSDAEDGIVVKKQLSKRTLKVLNAKWVSPSVDKALETLQYLHPRRGGKGKDSDPFHMADTSTGRHCVVNGCGEQCDMWGEGMISSFSIFGPGITNYFKFLKWLYWVFAILSIISLPELIINIYGAPGTEAGLNSLVMTTVGNLANNDNYYDGVYLPGCQATVFGADNCTLHRGSLGTFYCALDLSISTFILFAFAWLWVFERREEKKLDSMTWYTSMYAVAVRNLPLDTTEEELKHHFNNLLVFSEDEYITVNDVVIAHDSCRHIELLRERGTLLHKKARLVHYHRYEHSLLVDTYQESSPEYVEAESTRLKDEFTTNCAAIDEEIFEIDKKLIDVEAKKDVPVVAFVTFEHIVGAQMIKALYQQRFIDKVIKCLFPTTVDNKQDLFFKGNMLEIKSAPEPSTIIWENLESGVWERRGRRILTLMGAVLLVIASVIVTFGAKLLQQKAAASGGTGVCDVDFTNWSQEQQELSVEADPSTLHCYCDQYSAYQQNQLSLCKSYIAKKTAAQVLTFFSSFIVLAVSTLIEMAIRNFAYFEKHLSQDTKEMSIFLRLFFLKYLNTSIVFLINNNQQLMKYIFGTTEGGTATKNFSADWYSSIGVSIIIVQLGNCLSSQATTINQFAMYYMSIANANNSTGSCWKWLCCLFCCTKASNNTLVTQSELNKAYHGPEFELAFRYSSILSTMFVILTFSAGIPLLNPIAFISFGIYYYVDKYCFIKLYRTPHRYNASMGKMATLFIPFAVLLHLGMSMWMLANPEIFSNSVDLGQEGADFISSEAGALGSTFSRNISYHQTYPLFCYWLALAGLIVLFVALKVAVDVYTRFKILVRGEGDEEFKKYLMMFRAKASPSFSRAVRRNIITGLPTYNLLHNPIYKEHFGISWQFALRNNNTLRDVRKSTFVSGEDDDVIKAHYTAKLKYKLNEMNAKTHPSGKKKRVVSSALKGLDLKTENVRASLAREQSTFGRAKLIAEQLEKDDAHIVDEEAIAFDADANENVLDDAELAAYDAMIRAQSQSATVASTDPTEEFSV